MKNNVLCCIFNHNITENSVRWLDLLSERFDAFVLDSGSEVKNDRFLTYDNIYYGGLFNKALSMFNAGNYDWLLVLTSDVLIDDVNAGKLLNKIDYIKNSTNVGLFAPSVDITSGDYWGNVNNGTDNMYNVLVQNGFFHLINKKVLHEVGDKTGSDVFGYGIDLLLSSICNTKKLLNVVDYSIKAHHPNESGYSKSAARKEYNKFVELNSIGNYKELCEIENKRILITEYDIEQESDKRYKYSFIVPTRGREDMESSFQDNIKKVYGNESYEIIYMKQDYDNKLFKKGQLYNIGFKKAKGDYIILHDVDVLHLRHVDFEEQYNKIGHPYCCFDKITQLVKSGRGYKHEKTEDRPYGWGACVVLKREDFKKGYGFSNLCRGWGAEDNIFENRYKLKRYNQDLGHIKHPSASKTNEQATKFNRKVLGLVEAGKILPEFDGYEQTASNVLSDVIEDNIRTIVVDTITVPQKYKYDELYAESCLSDERIIVSLTSWPKRIGNLSNVLPYILNQSKQPDNIIVNLSLEEFPKKEKDFPVDFINYINKNDKVSVNWVHKNTKVWKKIFPVLLKYKDDLVISIDDDFIYPNDMIESFYKIHTNNPNSPISGNNITLFGMKCHCGCSSMVKYKHFGDYMLHVPEDVMLSGSSDIFYTYIANINGYSYLKTDQEYFNNMKTFNPVFGYSADRRGLVNKTYDLLKKTYPSNIGTPDSTVGSTKKVANKHSIKITPSPITQPPKKEMDGINKIPQITENSILCVILNNGMRSTSERLYNTYNKHFTTIVVDCPDGTYAKGYNKAMELYNNGIYSGILLVNANTYSCNDTANAIKLIKNIKNANNASNIGVYSPSYINVPSTYLSIRHTKNELRKVNVVDSKYMLINDNIMGYVKKINTDKNKSGVGFNEIVCNIAKQNGKVCVVDDSVYISVLTEPKYNTTMKEIERKYLLDDNLVDIAYLYGELVKTEIV